jgi:hypothetical protein
MTEALVVPLRLTPAQALELVQKELPTQRGEYRRDHDLFGDGSCFRVNFHSDENNVIMRSFFVRVKGGKLDY